ncbi:MAG: efflux RND transporter permease subunit [Geminicoccaceae bacterium]
MPPLLTLLENLLTGVLLTVYRHRVKALLVLVVAFVGYAGANLPALTKDGRIEAFMHENDPALDTYYQMRREYGQDNRLVVTVTAPTLFDLEFLERLKLLHRELQIEVPYVEEIFSLYNMPFIQHENGGLYLEELGRNVLARGREPAELEDRILSTPLYDDFIISDDGKTAGIILEPFRYAPHVNDCTPDPKNGIICPTHFTSTEERELLGAPHYREMTLAARDVAARHHADDFHIEIAGAPVVSTEIVAMMEQDMPRFTLACVVITTLVMLLLHRSVLIALGSLLTFVTALLGTLATMSLTGAAMTPPTQLIIPLTLVVSLCTYIHFVAACLRAARETENRADALAAAVRETHSPILFTALTTAGGLLGLLSSPLAPIATLGLFGALAVAFAFVLALFWATLALRTLPKRFFRRKHRGPGFVASAMSKGAAYTAGRPVGTLVVASLIVGVVSIGIVRLEYSHNSLLWLAPDNPARASTEYIDKRFNGTVNLEVIVTPLDGRDFRDEALLTTIEETAKRVPSLIDIPVGRHTSIISFVEESNQALNGGDPAARSVPSQQAIWDQLLMLESQGTDDMRRYVSLGYDEGRVSFLTPWIEAKRYAAAIETIQAEFESAVGDTAEVRTTGLIALLAHTSAAVLDSMGMTYAFALALIAALMCLALRSVRLGIISMIPNIAPFAMLLGVMGWLGLPLDTFTVLIGAIITGLIVDDTVHFFHRGRLNFASQADPQEAASKTALEIGGALFTTTIVVMLSFAVFMVSSMNNIQTFGVLMTLGAAFALVVDILVGPALLTLHRRRLPKASDRPALAPKAAVEPVTGAVHV